MDWSDIFIYAFLRLIWLTLGWHLHRIYLDFMGDKQ